MLLSRGASLVRAARLITQPKPVLINSVRNSGGQVYYRSAGRAPEGNFKKATVLGAIFWWWILWHCITEPDHVLGEFPYPDARKWTDAELGLPPE